jgi:TPP-dependent pyruvate/acetoin dehydrogenase alpha subunit
MKGVSVGEMMAGIFGKSTAYNAGRMPMRHMGDLDRGILLGSCIIGPGIAVSVGIGLAFKMSEEDRVVLCFFGDGATSEGLFHESLNFAGIHRLPIVFICENNGYAYTTPYERQVAGRRISDRARGYGFDGVTIDGNDVIAVYNACREATERARQGRGPSLIECMTYRFGPHTAWDHDAYRSQEEKERIQKRCPIRKLRQVLLSDGILDEERDQGLYSEINTEIERAIDSARRAPDPNWEELFDHIYATG